MSADLLSPEHREMLCRHAIAPDVALEGGVRSVFGVAGIPKHAAWSKATPGLIFPWCSPSALIVEQYRPDAPVVYDGTTHKYLWPKGQVLVFNVHPMQHERVMNPAVPLVVVEGTKQHLAAVTAARDLKVAVIGVAGCYGWMHDGRPLADLNAIPWIERDVVVIFDADLATNGQVWQAGHDLGAELGLRGAASVKFALLPGGKDGLDDVLASRAGEGDTAVVFEALLRRAAKLPRKPAKGPASAYFDAEGLKVAKLAAAVEERLHLAVDPSDRLLAYENGVYVDGRHAVTATISDLLGDQYRPLHARAVVEILVAELATSGKLMPEQPERALVNLTNGLLDPFTGDLHPHTPEHLSMVQFPIEWNPDAFCSTFDTWIDEVSDGRGDDLLEAAAQVLDMRGHRQRKALFLWGPTRSAKSTFVRLMEALVGRRARSAVTLHDLASNRFMKAELYGKVLNTAAELSAAHVDDLATFKQATGDDPMNAERKYGQPFTFTSRAVFVFAANEIPTVSEVSGAYLARIRPYRFPHSFEGRENPAIETAMMGELPGILVRLVEALRRFEARGGYADDPEARGALDDFARHSDRVRLFLHEACRIDPDAFVGRSMLFDEFEEWARQNRRQSLGRHRFYDHVATAGFRAATRQGLRGYVGIDVLPRADWGTGDDEPDARVQKVQNIHTPASREENSEGVDAEEGRVKGGWTEPAPSAPCPTGDREEEEW